jgi:SAM-dependent methyltransferase
MSTDRRPVARVSVEVPLEPSAAFATLIEELGAALLERGIRLDARAGGPVMHEGEEIARVRVWDPPRRAVLEWQSTPWESTDTTEVELRVESSGGGAEVVIEHRGFGTQLGSGANMVGWFATSVGATFLEAAAPRRVGDWITDRLAGRPTGQESVAVYRDPLYHYPGFRAILAELQLRSDDYLLEVGCGGGVLLKQALESGCRAAGVDHSPDMVRAACETNRDAIGAGRVEIVRATADSLPFHDALFTCATMHGVLGFLPDPVAALAEIRRVLRSGGRIVIAGSDPELKGTPGAPEPMASRLRFYDDQELVELGRAAGFAEVRVARRDLEQYARDAGIPEEHVPLFSGAGTRFLIATR